MAASSPVQSNNSNDTIGNAMTKIAMAAASPVLSNDTPTPTPQRSGTPKQNLRGLNKPKCSKCGNVARSRTNLSYHFHVWTEIAVLKPNATFPDKIPSSNSPLFDQQSTDVSSTGTSLRVASLRQLSSNFAQFNGAQVSIRARRPLTRKDAAAINQWRFSKLKEYKNGNIEAENEAFNRYMQNVSLLEEAFSVNSSLEGLTVDGSPALDPTSISGDNGTGKMISQVKMRLRSNTGRMDNFRQRIQDLVDRGLKKLQTWEINDDGAVDDLDGQKGIKRLKKAENWQAKRTSAVSDLIDKLNKARNEEDLKSCLEMKSQLFNRDEKSSLTGSKDVETSKEQIAKDPSSISRHELHYSLPRLCSMTEINQETLNSIDKHFSSLEQIEDL
ncbi:hypothetical protein HHK36_028119 [Tetracentron sinense]|uniref:Uncharacterized protein n=1 Tax=Tetracentron sinense TaxID=13715 RepID=A0A834YHV1_TETSI|nr:hypothetical protein HHK36_028119 [Tetracentron sinense]